MSPSFQQLIQGEQPVLVDFHANWCGPCKVMAPELAQLKQLLGEQIRILKIDVDRNRHAAETYHISGVPTLILFKKGQILWRQSGVMKAGQIADVIQTFSGK